MENKAHALAAGLFTIVLGLALVLTGLWFTQADSQPVSYVLVPTGSVTGLKAEAPVRYRGVDVGRVTGIRLEPGNTGRVLVDIGVQADTPVTKNTYAQLGYQGVTGIAYVQLSDDGNSREKLVAEAGKPAQIRMKPSFLDDGEALFTTFTELSEKINRLIEKGNVDKVFGTLASIEQFTQRAGTMIKTIEPALNTLPGLITETRGLATEASASLRRVDQIAGNADKFLVSANQLALKLDQRIPTLDLMAATARDAGVMVRTLNEESVPKVNAFIDDLVRETRSIDRAVERVVNSLVEQPQSFVFGPPAARPGPGEPGFNGGK